MFNIIPLIIILISFIIIISIVVKKFSALASLDVSSIQAEREAVFKERIMGNRIKRGYFNYYSKVIKIFRPAFEWLGEYFKKLYKKLIELKDNYNTEATMAVDVDSKINKLFFDAEEEKKKNNHNDAEKKYIEIISLDSKNIKAFRLLGELYYEIKKLQEAEQTFSHVLKLVEKDSDLRDVEKNELAKNGDENIVQMAETYFDLSEVYKEQSNFEKALINIDKALELISNNPRYLDIKIEISIINKDKNSALVAYKKLEMVNPDNQKLGEFKKQIEDLL